MSQGSRVIAFDGSILGAGPITGVAGSFLTTLRRYVESQGDECALLLPRDCAGDFAAGDLLRIEGLRCVPCLPRGRLRRLRALRRVCREIDADVLHSPLAAVPVRSRCPVIATVHDLPWLYPLLRGEPGSRFTQRLALRSAMRFATAVILPSQATLADVKRYINIDGTDLRVIPHGVEPVETIAEESALRGRFLVLGDDRPRKNTKRVRRAHALARESCADLPDLQLLGPDHRYVDEATKWSTLRQSRALLHLSLLEGFGLPVLEAFAHGVPVVCSDRGSLPEVAGDAALTVNPEDDDAIAAAIVRIHREAELRSELRRLGVARAAELTPERSAQAWRNLHEDLLS